MPCCGHDLRIRARSEPAPRVPRERATRGSTPRLASAAAYPVDYNRYMLARVFVIALLGCGSRPAPIPHAVRSEEPVAKPARRDFTVTDTPQHLVVAGKHLVWTDVTGAV